MKRAIALLLILHISLFMLQASAQRRGRIENVTDYSTLATPSAHGQHRVGTRASAPLPCVGSPRIPVILVQFSDLQFTVASTSEDVHQNYVDFFNAGEGIQPGAPNSTSYSSVTEYFRTQSSGLFTPQFEVIGPFTLDSSYVYYGKNSGNGKDVNISKFYSEACRQAVASTGIDWADFDNNGDGRVDLVFFIYAGEGENASDDPATIWPKESSSSLTITYDNQRVVFGAYGCTNELFNGLQDGIGTIIHELGHGLGLPDFYDTVGSAFGLDYWDIMDSGCYQVYGRQPCSMSAYELDFMGWRELVTLNPDSAYTLRLAPLEVGGTAYKVVNPANTNEYFVLENRQTLNYDIYLGWPTRNLDRQYGKNHGLMITHVDYLASAWTSNRVNTNASHQRITITPADGQLISYWDSNNSSDNHANWAQSMRGDLYPGACGVTEISSYKVFTGGTIRQTIQNIRETSDGYITLDINGGNHHPNDLDGDGIITFRDISILLRRYLGTAR